jgi:hypothetical protein
VDGETDDTAAQWRRLFTVAEANALLPALIPHLETLRRQKAELDEARRALARLTPAMRGNGHGAEVAALERRFRALAEEITGWRLGEGEIAWWHEIDGGFAGRQPL